MMIRITYYAESTYDHKLGLHLFDKFFDSLDGGRGTIWLSYTAFYGFEHLSDVAYILWEG